MRDELVFKASVCIPNRYRLCRMVALASRKLHRPMNRMEDTVNTALRYVNRSCSTSFLPKTIIPTYASGLRETFEKAPTVLVTHRNYDGRESSKVAQ